MRLYIVFYILAFYTQSQAQEFSLFEARNLFIEATKNEEIANKLFELTKNSAIDINYKQHSYNAIAILLKSKYSANPFHKIKLFKKGKKKLDMVIHEFPNDIELRFLRFCVQNDTPEIINYKKNIKQDSQLINDNISKSCQELQQFILPIFKTLNNGRTSYTSR